MSPLVTRMRYDRLRARCFPLRSAIVGCYHGLNLGDTALRDAVLRLYREAGLARPTPLLSSGLKWYRPPQRLTLGGGALGLPDVLHILESWYRETPEKVAFLGVDFAPNGLTPEVITFLRRVPFISCRSRPHAEWLGRMLERPDVLATPDLSWIHYEPARLNRKADAQYEVGINLSPFSATLHQGMIVDKTEFPEGEGAMRSAGAKLAEAHRDVFREVVRGFRAKGVEIHHFPFSPWDDTYARQVFKNNEVVFRPYDPNPLRMMTELGRCGDFFTTRLHALLLGAMSGTRLHPFLYAKKCVEQIEGMGLDAERFLTPERLFELPLDQAVDMLLQNSVSEQHHRDVWQGFPDRVREAFGRLATGRQKV